MSRNKSTSAWYPTKDFDQYAYASSLRKEDNERAKVALDNALALLSSAKSSMSNVDYLDISYNNLDALWRQEREAEKAFIDKFLKVELDYGDKNEIQKLLQSINTILNSKSQLEATIKTIKSLEFDQDKGKNNSVSTAIQAFATYQLPEVIKTTYNTFIEKYYNVNMTPEMMADTFSSLLSNDVSKVIKTTLYTVESSTGVNPYQELVDYIESIGGMDEFINSIFVAYGIDKQSILARAKKPNPDKTAKDALKSISFNTNKRGGSVAETIRYYFAKAITQGKPKSLIIDTAGANNQKSDLTLIFGDVEVSIEDLQKTFTDAVIDISKTERSKRLQNMAALEKMLENVNDANNSIVLISEKSYNLSGQAFRKGSKKYGGFGAEDLNLVSLYKTLSTSNMNSKQLEDLIFLLVNSGQGMINNYNDLDGAMQVISLQVAKFLFDDAVVTENFSPYQNTANRIHLFDLNGVFVPLSVFLEGVAYAFKNNKDELADFVVAKFHMKQIEPNSDSNKDLTEEDWNWFYQQKLSNNYVSIHFFGDFINFIKKNF